MENVIEIEHLKKSFGNNQVLKDISLSLAKGENLVILGKSGTGKSVLIKCIVGLITPDEGKLTALQNNILELLEILLSFLFFRTATWMGFGAVRCIGWTAPTRSPDRSGALR